MLTEQTTLKLCKFLIQVGEEEKNLEVVRQILSEQPDFEPYAAFTRIDRQRNGFLHVGNIKEFLANNGIIHDDNSCAYFIQQYDGNNDGKLHFEEFLSAVLPAENNALRSIVTQRKTYAVEQNQMLSYDVEYALARIFDREIQFFKKMDPFKIALKNCRDFSPKDAFFTIDLYNSKYIDFVKLGEFLIKHGFDLFEDQLLAIVRNIDKNDDGRIELHEFIEAIEPKYELQAHNMQKMSFCSPEDPVQIYKDGTKTTQAFYNNNQETIKQQQQSNKNPSQLFKQYISPNQRTTLSIQKHVDKLNSKNQAKRSKSNQRNRQFSPSKTCKFDLHKQKLAEKQKKEELFAKMIEAELDEIARTLKMFIALDKEVEIMKENLVSRQDFNLHDAFRLFDVDGKGICQPGDFMEVINAFGLFPTKYELYLVLKRFDYDQDGKLSFNEFKEMLLPVKKEYEAMANERPPVGQKDLFMDILSPLWSPDTRQNFINLIKILLQNEAANESLRQRLNKREHFNLKQIFNFVDLDCDGFWRVSDLKRIFDNAGIIIQKKDLYYLILRFDRNSNAKISYSEFISEIAPKSTQKF